MNSNRIYIVEDSFMIALHLKKVLELNEYEVVGMADSGEKALQEIMQLNPDLVLMDIMLAGVMRGTELAARLKANTTIPFIYITALSDKETIQSVKVTEPHGYLNKPFDESKVLNIMEMALYKAKAEKSLRQSEADLYSTFNNTSIMVWSVDRDFNILMANDAFKTCIREKLNVEIVPGKKIFHQGQNDPEIKFLRDTWREKYNQALAGNSIKFSDALGDQYFDFSLNPILQAGQIVGITVFAEDVTKRVVRDRELQDYIKQISELRLAAVRSAMNPHFIFNALNSIQYFIATQDRKNAMQHLSTFSKLVRSILVHSTSDQIPLDDELEIVKNYVALELLRFENKFDFILTVNTQTPLDQIEVPSFFIQPYLENAILNGLCDGNEKGKLELTIYETVDLLNVEIKDNVTLRNAVLANEKDHVEQKSGLSLGEGRLKLIDRVRELKLIDLEDAIGNPTGTLVKIKIDLIKSKLKIH